ncbi:hypothetical protein FF38_14540 [Lucilia cuprina]|uniref:Ig-like domain-containing protein n=1 Tax=Lucilia cuprina TaxID=7375 RepID=A0A0L0CKQ0_LUCCU|nr:hypothetical protein FF38_14540 [Lucilia cuprina]
MGKLAGCNVWKNYIKLYGRYVYDWTLQIKFVQQRDAGIYECQVSTHPPTSIFLHLLVVEARAEISGPHIRYLTPGSTLRLQCHVVQNTEISEYIFWYHDNRMINYDADRGINVSTDPDFQSSELTISRTRREHSGNYTCVASNTQPASVLVHIFKGNIYLFSCRIFMFSLK